MRDPIRLSLVVWALGLPMWCGCDRADAGPSAPAAKEPPAAKIEAPVKEAELTRVVLTEQAEQRLGITTAPVEHKSLLRTRLYGGTVTVPQGGVLSHSAPLAGTILNCGTPLPPPGTRVSKGQDLMKLSPVLAGESEVLSPADRLTMARVKTDLAASRTDAAGRVQAAEAQLEASTAQRARAETLLKQEAGSRQAYEQALAAERKAAADLQAAQAGLEILGNIHLEARPESAMALVIQAPFDGMVTRLAERDGMLVAAGTPLIEISALDPIWLRVPVYVGDLKSLAPKSGVRAAPPGAGEDDWTLRPSLIHPVPSGNAAAVTVDLWFELPNTEMRWAPDEKLLVRIPRKTPEQVRVVPWSAIVLDVHGGAWVYVAAAPHTYSRQRVEVSEVVDGLAVLARGPETGTPVVIAGVAELFGTEFGSGK